MKTKTKKKELPKGVCPSCWGKKFNSIMTRKIGRPDFPDDKGFDTGSYIENIICSKCNGTGKDPKFKKNTLVKTPKNTLVKGVKAWIHKSAIESRQNVFYPHDIIVHNPEEYVAVIITPISKVAKKGSKK